MKRHPSFFASLLLLIIMLPSCSSWREVEYFQDLNEVQLHNKLTESDVKIRPGDQITIMVFGADKYLIMPYNQTLNSVSEGNLGSGGTREAQSPYDVDENGDIKFPVLGKIHVAGMTTNELQRYLHSLLDDTIKDMTLFIAIENFRINVMGEVNHPGSFNIKNNTCTFLEALSLAGDMKLTANRHKVKLIRLEDGQVRHYEFDLTNSEILDSKELFLQQNDVIYVPPVSAKADEARSNGAARTWVIGGATLLISVISLIITLSKN